ncbi:heavy-metal-associated domain-containing protein [Aridibaculum aurantiacum]|uniref:heavy-metal-associated domain-containing protein n=1 Tax=Aridibaculum aurantiacum TaxID=2810307 RepID=UPI001A958CCE|nr:heavy-metal-associated domain-containing protein [Aridibaculum aurantiacum]
MKYTYKTNINCMGCVGQVKPHLDKLEQEQDIDHWHIDVDNPQKILTIETNSLSSEEVETIIQDAGFNAIPVAS